VVDHRAVVREQTARNIERSQLGEQQFVWDEGGGPGFDELVGGNAMLKGYRDILAEVCVRASWPGNLHRSSRLYRDQPQLPVATCPDLASSHSSTSPGQPSWLWVGHFTLLENVTVSILDSKGQCRAIGQIQTAFAQLGGFVRSRHASMPRILFVGSTAHLLQSVPLRKCGH
jgi:hypothetical protein